MDIVSKNAKYEVYKITDSTNDYFNKYIVKYLTVHNWLRNNKGEIVVFEEVPSHFFSTEENTTEENQHPNPAGGGKYKRFVRTIRKRQRKSRPTTRRQKRSSRTTSRRRYRKK